MTSVSDTKNTGQGKCVLHKSKSVGEKSAIFEPNEKIIPKRLFSIVLHPTDKIAN